MWQITTLTSSKELNKHSIDSFIKNGLCIFFHSQAMSIALQEGLLNGVKKKKRPKVKKEISNINL
jgi:cobalamin biosynthesis protein CbiG